MTISSGDVTAQQVADFFLTYRDDEDELTHLKLQKLCYYAQAYHLAAFGIRLFNERLEAWDHGPVVRSIWDRFAYHREVLPRPESFEPEGISSDTLEFLDRVYQEYGQYAAWKLREMTHREQPWIEAMEGGGILSDETMREYFRDRIEALTSARKLSVNEIRQLVERPDVKEAIALSREDFARGAFREA